MMKIIKKIMKKLTKNRINMVREYDGLTRSEQKLAEYEQKYGILSGDWYHRNCSMNDIEDADRYMWEAYVNCYLAAGGVLKTRQENAGALSENVFVCEGIGQQELLSKPNIDIKKRSDGDTSLLSFFAKNVDL